MFKRRIDLLKNQSIIAARIFANPFHCLEGMPILFSARGLRMLWGKIRRFGLCAFDPHYVEQQLSLRQGSCNQCGACCKLMFSCPYLKENRCLIYDTCRPDVCKRFPIDERDLRNVNEVCSYSFPTKLPEVIPTPSFPRLWDRRPKYDPDL